MEHYKTLLEKYKISTEFITKLNNCLNKLDSQLGDNRLEDILRHLSLLNLLVPFNECANSTNYINFLTPSDCKYLDLHKWQPNGPFWFFGSHAKKENNDVLIGFLKIHKCGVIILKDTCYSIACVITYSDRTSITPYINNFVIVKNFRVFTECYSQKTATNSEYLYFNLADVDILKSNSLQPQNKENLKIGYQEGMYKYALKFHIRKKSTVCLSLRNTPEIWFEIGVEEENKPPRNELMCLGPLLLSEGIFLEEGQEYILHHSNECEKYRNKAIDKAQPFLHSWVLNEENAFLQVVGPSKFYKDQLILNVEMALDNLANNSYGRFVSFKGKVLYKKFAKPLDLNKGSKTTRGFGTPGTKTHILEFSSQNGPRTLKLYLNDWDQLQVPLGLLPDMIILVRNVAEQKGKYYKCTSFTTFEVLEYKPMVPFETANLYAEKCSFSKGSFLGFGHFVPNDVLIWASIFWIKIRSLRITFSCSLCQDEQCFCDFSERHIKMTMTCYVRDEMGEVILICNNLDVLRQILNIEKNPWDIWCKAFKEIGIPYIYNKNPHEDFEGTFEVRSFRKNLKLLINCVNLTNTIKLDLLCRKMAKKDNDYNNLPTWYCVEAKQD